jgi:hypothetical protein
MNEFFQQVLSGFVEVEPELEYWTEHFWSVPENGQNFGEVLSDYFAGEGWLRGVVERACQGQLEADLVQELREFLKVREVGGQFWLNPTMGVSWRNKPNGPESGPFEC